VILGPDLLFRDGRPVIGRKANKDPDLGKSMTDEGAGALVRNIYRVLLTRGMEGAALHSADAETQGFLRGLVSAEE